MIQPRIRVLLIEDNPGDARLVQELLWGATGGPSRFEIELADRLSQGLERLSSSDVDVVLLDLGLPDSKGPDTLRRLRQETEKAVVVVLTGLDDEEVAIQCLLHGAQDYLVKGRFDAHLLGRSVRYAVERKRAEEALRKSEHRYKTLVENLPQKVFLKDKDSVYVSCNANYARDLKINPDEIAGQADFDFHPVELAEKYRADDKRIMKSGKTEDLEEPYRQDGQQKCVHTVKTPVKDEHGNVTGILGIFWDVTERKQAEQTQARLVAILDATPDFVGFADAKDTHILYINPAGRKMVGVGAQEDVTRLKIADVHPEWTNKLFRDEIIPTAIRDGVWTGECAFLNRDGREIPVLMVLLAHKSPSGEVERFSTISHDITERKRAEEEREKLEAQLLQAQKMEAVGRLAGGVAHDFNNLLTVIGGNADLAASTPHLPEDAHRRLSEITQATERAANLTRQLLAFSRRQALEPRVVSLNDVLSNMDKMLRRLIGEDIELTTRPAKDLSAVCVDVGQMEQVVVNLAVNACDAMPNGGRLVFETANAHLDEEYARSHSDVTPGHHVMLAVSDTGVGMTNEVKERIFEPFFTTKEMGKGTGLGLSTCYGIIKQHGGNIWVYSEPGKGTRFKIYLPRVEKEPGALPQREETADLPPGGNETILLVEDDASVRAVASRILRDQGYTVSEAGNGEEALQIARRAPGRTIHLVLTDVVMPRMGGKELSQRLKALRPSIKVLFTSGYTETAVVHNSAFEPGFALLQKPFTKIALARKVREVLDS